MKPRLKTSACGVALMLATNPVVAQAQEASGALTLGYGYSDVSDNGGDISSFTADAAGNIAFNQNTNLGLYGSFIKADPDAGGDITLGDVGAKLTYQFQNGFLLGGYVDHASLDVGLGLGDIDTTSYGGSFGFASGAFVAEGFVGMTEPSPDLASNTDWTDFGATVRYKVSPKARIGGHLIRSEISGAGQDIDIDSFGVGGDMAFGNGWSTFGGVSYSEVDLISTDLTTVGVGVSYDLRQVSAIPGAVSLEVARSNVSAPGADGDIDTLRLGLTFPLGGQENATPLNSVDRMSIAPRHNSLSTLLNAAF